MIQLATGVMLKSRGRRDVVVFTQRRDGATKAWTQIEDFGFKTLRRRVVA
jgi:hypothetical protein